MKSVSFSWRMAINLHAKIKQLADKRGIAIATMLNIIVNENLSKYE